jgi:hypothetical protein
MHVTCLAQCFLRRRNHRVDFVCREKFRNIVTEPLTDLLVTGVDWRPELHLEALQIVPVPRNLRVGNIAFPPGRFAETIRLQSRLFN